MNPLTKNMFTAVRDALEKNDSKESYGDIMSLKVGNTYTVRLLPNTKDLENTFFHFYTFSWNSRSTGQFVSAISPTSFGHRDPIAEERFRIYRNGTDAEKQEMKDCNLKRQEKWLANVYVVDDPVNPDNNGTIKMIRYGKQLHKVIDSAVRGEDADDYGEKVFDLSSDGCSLKIKVDEQGEGERKWPSYTLSKFGLPSEIAGMSEEKMNEVYEGVHDLAKVFTVKTYQELKDMWDEHYTGAGDIPVPETEASEPVQESAPTEAESTPAPEATETPSEEFDPEDEDMAALLEELEQE